MTQEQLLYSAALRFISEKRASFRGGNPLETYRNYCKRTGIEPRI